MSEFTPAPPVGESEPALVGRLTFVEKICLATVALAIAANFAERFLPQARSIWRPMSWEVALAILLTALSLCLFRSTLNKPVLWLSRALALLVTLGMSATLATQALLRCPGMDTGADMSLASSHQAWSQIVDWISPQSAAAFAVLGITVALVGTRRRGLRRVADFFAFGSLVMVLVLGSAQIIAQMHIFGAVGPPRTAAGTLLCLLALTVIAFIHHAQNGVFSVLFGPGLGSKLARRLAPILVFVPYLREIARARLLNRHWISPDYSTAILASAFAAVATSILLYVSWRLNALEAEIHSLSLRDDLTGLYNLRGFRLLAEPLLLLAHRSGQPFSIIFLDLDNLKQINDALGHQAGSAFLVEMAEILRETFRETDVLARIGGDEFAVAGQIDSTAIADAAKRVRQAAAERNAHAGRAVGLSFSLGCITSEAGAHEPLVDLLARADKQMYCEKRRRKSLPKSKPAPSGETRHGISPEYLATGLRKLGRTGKCQPKEIA